MMTAWQGRALDAIAIKLSNSHAKAFPRL